MKIKKPCIKARIFNYMLENTHTIRAKKQELRIGIQGKLQKHVKTLIYRLYTYF